MALIFGLTFLAVFLMSVAVFSLPLASRLRVRGSLNQLTAYSVSTRAGEATGNTSFMDRIVWPILGRISRNTHRWTDAARLENIRYRLILAGVRSLSAEKFYSLKLGLAAIGLVFYLLIGLPWLVAGGRSPLLGLTIVAAAYYLPDIWLRQRAETRQRQIGAALADSIDILTIGIEAGLAFDSAIAKVAKNIEGPLSEELGRMLGELQIGVSRREALKNLGNRTTVAELQTFCTTLVQADTLGISIGKILRTEAVELRTRRRQAAEEQAMKTPVKMVFPIVLCILPALMIVIIGPAAIRIAVSLLSRF